MIATFLSLFTRFWPYLLAAFIGASAAWGIQQGRLDRLDLEFAQYKLAIGQAAADEKERTQKLTEQTSHDYLQNLDALHAYYRNQPRRVLQGNYPSGTGISAPACAVQGRPADATFSTGEPETSVEDCAKVTYDYLWLRHWYESIAQ